MAPTDGFYPIVGIQDGLDPDKKKLLRVVPVRMEVDEWYQSQKPIHINQRALFFPAFWKFQQMSPQAKISWFQIAGIHGKPFVAWDEPPQKGLADNSGYCTHNSMLFSTWHRPYMLLWEQAIYELMKKEIESYTPAERTGLLEAAQSWRWPFWDWASKKPLPDNPSLWDYNVPLVMNSRTVRIRLPAPKMEGEVPNAFYEFKMPGDVNMGDITLQDKDRNPLKDLRIVPTKTPKYSIPFDQCRATSRHPKGKGIDIDWQNGKQNNMEVNKGLRDYPTKSAEKERLGNLTASLRDAFYRVTTISTFEDFSTKRLAGSGAEEKKMKQDYAFDSAESLHDNVHFWCGGPSGEIDSNGNVLLGHMTHVPVAAFDPIFWLHHCNVDRLIAIWQILHETAWWNSPEDLRNEDIGNFAIKFKHMDNPKDNLRPFHKDAQGNYWTSDDAREPTVMGYTYTDLEKWKHTNPDGSYNKEEHIGYVTQSLNQKYNSAKSASIKARLTADPNTEGGLGLMSMSSLIQAASWQPEDISVDDYVVNVVYEKFALNGASFSIHIFVGKVPEQLPYGFQEPGTQVGEVANFSTEADSMGNSTDGCQNCRSQQADQTRSTGRIILTNALITRFKEQVDHEPEGDGPRILQSMHPDDVVKFLKYNLHWRVTSIGSLIPTESMPSLKVSLAVGKAEHYADDTKLSKFHEYRGAFDATQGKAGGAGPEDNLYPVGAEFTTQS